MKFRYKVLIANIIILSISIGLVGFFMIDKNFNLALEQQIKNAIEENNLFQASIEYELLRNINQTPTYASLNNEVFIDAGENVHSNMSANNSKLYIVYNNNLLYSSHNVDFEDSLWKNTDIGKKNYIITSSDSQYTIHVASSNALMGKSLNIITSRDITSAFSMMKNQAKYYKLLLLLVLIICSTILYIISYYLTKPLETLGKASESFGKGKYDSRVNITSQDEIGKLANTYNQMADAVSHHMKELESMVTRQEQFVADFTHEIKTPMTSIIGYADTLRSRELSREQQILAASYIFSEGKRLEAMSMKLFEFIYTKQHNITTVNIQLSRLMQEVYDSVYPMLEAKSITLVPDIEDCIIKGDIALLKSSFINLIDNARKASAKGSKIIFSSTLHDNKVTIIVKDFGIGISKEHLDKICDEFYMVDKSRSRSEGGAGLGLSLAALVFKVHEAVFNITSIVNEGTEVSVTFTQSEEVNPNE